MTDDISRQNSTTTIKLSNIISELLWVRYYRLGLLEVAVNTNNGVESKNKEFKYGYLSKFHDKSLSGMITVLVEQFLPDKYNSYVESNFKASGYYRSYQQSLPSWLHNRPKKFVAHCIEKLDSSKFIASNLIYKDGVVFKVKSEKNDNTYEVFFGDELRMPSCSCFDWKKNLLPCKHMLAVTTKYKISWDSFGTQYKNSVFLNLDFDVMGSRTVKSESMSIKEPCPVDDPSQLSNIPIKSYPKQGKASICRELLNQIKSLTYLIESQEVFDQLEERLQTALKDCEESTCKDHGLVVEHEKKRYRAICQTNKIYFDMLPSTKKKKSNLSGRVGIANDARKAASKISIRTEASGKKN
ncbi:uncharacterized protein LOC136082971 [Hydra vulgaris]|uniref:Uncharacterized protein LOC136082971 n=1 Tax=Hydra vulgaris TaxID=6087 RepID=A0ABM4C9W3_HYDVU